MKENLDMSRSGNGLGVRVPEVRRIFVLSDDEG